MRDQSPKRRLAKAGFVMRWLMASPSAVAGAAERTSVSSIRGDVGAFSFGLPFMASSPANRGSAPPPQAPARRHAGGPAPSQAAEPGTSVDDDTILGRHRAARRAESHL